MKREIARRRLARLKEETQEVLQEDDPSPRLVVNYLIAIYYQFIYTFVRLSIFKKTAGKTTSPVSVRSSRQQIFQVRLFRCDSISRLGVCMRVSE